MFRKKNHLPNALKDRSAYEKLSRNKQNYKHYVLKFGVGHKIIFRVSLNVYFGQFLRFE